MNIFDTIKANPLLVSGGTLWAAGVLTYLVKDIPIKISNFSKKHLTTSVSVTTSWDSFYALTEWFEKSSHAKTFRTLRIARDHTLAVGFGSHFFIYKKRLCWLERSRIESKNYDLEELTITYIGRDQQFLRDFLKEAIAVYTSETKTKIYTPSDGYWQLRATQEPRPLSSVLLSAENRKALEQHFATYFSQGDWYLKHGIPYRTGICLSGPPGTGKTSLVKALCAEYKLRLCVLDLATMSNAQLLDLLSQLKKEDLILIEDIDTSSVTEDRNQKIEDGKISLSTLTLGGVLNAIDGVVGASGRILVVTTNKLDKIDPALLRPGRIDLTLELSYMTPPMFREAMANFFPGVVQRECRWPSKMTPASFQQIILRHKDDPDKVLEAVQLFETLEQPQA